MRRCIFLMMLLIMVFLLSGCQSLSFFQHTASSTSVETGLSITSEPSGLFVELDGELLGNTPIYLGGEMTGIEPGGRSVTISTVDGYTLETLIQGRGTISREPDQDAYSIFRQEDHLFVQAGQILTHHVVCEMDQIELTAEADPGWSFLEWTGDLESTDNPVTLTMDTNKQVTAVFTYRVSGRVVDEEGRGMEGVEITFSGGHSSVMTEGDGSWSKNGLLGEVTVTPSMSGYTFIPSRRSVSGFAEDVNFTGRLEFYSEDFGQGFLCNWQFTGHEDWVMDDSTSTTAGQSARSGSITHNQTSGMTLVVHVREPGTISFDRGVSSENRYDFLNFYVDGERIERWSGEEDWERMTYNIEPGLREFEWRYTKDGSVSRGEDCGWIDNIFITGVLPETYRISGTVLDEAGNGIGGVEITFSDGFHAVMTEEDGTWSKDGLRDTVTVEPHMEGYQFDPSSRVLSSPSNVVNFVGSIETYYEDFGQGFSSNWQFTGHGDWIIDASTSTTAGQSARSGSITHNQTSGLRILVHVREPGTISFDRGVSSENRYDFLNFYVDGERIERWSGEEDWERMTYNVEPGLRELEWRYTKDGSVSRGEDCGWIDNIFITGYPVMP